jgi:hypothetical protein
LSKEIKINSVPHALYMPYSLEIFDTYRNRDSEVTPYRTYLFLTGAYTINAIGATNTNSLIEIQEIKGINVRIKIVSAE